MAKAIQKVEKLPVNPVFEAEKNKEELVDTIVQHKDSITSLIRIVDKLESRGLLEIVEALLTRGDKVLSILMEELNEPKLRNILDRLVNVAEIIGDIEIEKLKHLTTQVNAGIVEAESQLKDNKETTLVDLLRTLRDPEINRTITVFLGFLKGAGKIENI